jgi:hypothetical protein
MRKVTWKKGLSVALAAAMMAGTLYLPAGNVLSDTAIVQAAQTLMPENPTVINGYVYATVNMEYEDFYYGELNEIGVSGQDATLALSTDVVDGVYASGAYDAVTSATTQKSIRFGATYYTEEANDEADAGVSINGVKDVKIRISKALYDQIKDEETKGTEHSIITYLQNATYSDSAYDEYKEVRADGTFAKMETTTEKDEDAQCHYQRSQHGEIISYQLVILVHHLQPFQQIT